MHPVGRANGREREAMASQQLPHSPDLHQLRRRARELQRGHAAGEPAALRLLREELRRVPEPLPLTLAQHALARSYGFASWADLKHAVTSLAVAAELARRFTGTPNRAFPALRASGRVPAAALVPGLRHPNPRVRFDCLALLDHLADEGCVPAMLEATRDPVARVRRMAVHALGCQRCKAAPLGCDLTATLVELAQRDESWTVRVEAVLALAQRPPSDASRAALAALAAADPHPGVRARAGWAARLQAGGGRSYTGASRL